MGENKDSSVLFSLKELMSLEEDRIRGEEDARQRAAQAELQSRQDAERRVREEEEARIRTEEERRRSEEQRQREEVARLDAIRHGEVEKARLDAENAARLDAMRAQQDHERQLTALKENTGKKRLAMIASGTGVILFLALVGGGLALKNQSDAADREKARHAQELAEQKAQVDKLSRELQEQSNNIASLEGAVQNAKDDAARKAAQIALNEAQKQRAATAQQLTNVQRNPAHGGGNTPRTACTCQAGDPLCNCL
jgi:colicin import membrane protein